MEKKDVLWCIKTLVYDLISNILNVFDENSLNNIELVYELNFHCLHEHESLSERFWSECKQEERDNITILFSNIVELFPLHMDKLLNYLSLISSNKNLCLQVVDYLCNNLTSYSEYFDENSFKQNDYQFLSSDNGCDRIRLLRKRILFDNYQLPVNYEGLLIRNNSKSSFYTNNLMIVTWNVNYNALNFVKIFYKNLIQYLTNNNGQITTDNLSNLYSIVMLTNSILKNIFNINDISTSYFKHAEDLVKHSFQLFTSILSIDENTHLIGIINKLFEILLNIPEDLSHKVSLIVSTSNLTTAKFNLF